MNKELNDFSAKEVALEGTNLIEASAGTGKTYSIAILALRLILEKKLSIKEILMVTFTKAAVSELEERIRVFVRMAYRASLDKSIEDSTIRQIVEQAVQHSGPEKVRELLNEARLFLDETSVMTIHSFCQQSLSEFAFETDQLFGADILQDVSGLIDQEVNRFWRENITVLDPELLKFLLKFGLCRQLFVDMVVKHQDGVRYLGYDPELHYSFSATEQQLMLNAILEADRALSLFNEELYKEIRNSSEELRKVCESNTHARKALLPLIEEPEAFLQLIAEKKTTGYVVKLFSDWLEKIEVADELREKLAIAVKAPMELLIGYALQEAGKRIRLHKEHNSLLTFNDMIVKLSLALDKEKGQQLILELRKKYKAVFIDEFQDTDQHQYRIFNKAFGKETILFFIGDPKQSIYAWRQADLDTYFKASREVDHVYGMNQNYRSSERFIDAMNAFFLPSADFDAFHFDGKDEGIRYIPVESPQPNRKGCFLQDDLELTPITIYSNSKNEDLYQDTCKQIAHLLENKSYQIKKEGVSRSIRPSDIGVLVRKSAEGQAIQKILGKMGIPAITLDDSKVLQSKEAQYLYYLIKAIIDPTQKNINTALLSPLTGFSRDEILDMDSDRELENFKIYRLQWYRQGVYSTLTKFVVEYEVKDNLLNNRIINGERSLTNVLQIIEILQKVQSSRNFSPWELLNWLKRSLEGMRTEGDEYEQRVESDRDAVEIVTIHKSKGLEYNLVFAPTLDLTLSKKREFCSFKDHHSGLYVFGRTSDLDDNQLLMYQRQEEQENRRLLYVAITRAVYTCYIGKNTYYKNSSLGAFLANDFPPELIRYSTPEELPENYRYSNSASAVGTFAATADNFTIQSEQWRKLSYSFLKKDIPHRYSGSAEGLQEGYDYFIFRQMLKGSLTGNLLHDIFENIDFRSSAQWDRTVDNALMRFMPRQLENYRLPLNQLLEETIKASISIGDALFSLSEVSRERRLNELEFDFNVTSFSPTALNALSRPDAPYLVNTFGQLAGVMNGKVDLFFEHQGKFYILDWKSNFLGDLLEDYDQAHLHEAMTANNYHLQYLIYTVAVKRYLEGRMPAFDYERDFGGVIYLFVRGTREGSTSGVYTRTPSLDEIEELEKLLTGSDIKGFSYI